MKHLTDAELTSLLDFCSTQRDPRVLLIELLARTGMRTEELTRLRAKDFVSSWSHDAKYAAVFIHGAKNSRSDYMPLPTVFYERLKQGLLGRLEPNDLVFSLFTKNPESIHVKLNIRRYWYMVRSKVFGERLKEYGVHSLRHTFALKIYKESQFNLIHVQKALRHKALSSTVRYLDYVQNKEIGQHVLAAIK